MIEHPAGRGRSAVHSVRSREDGYGITLVLTILTVGSLAAAGEKAGGLIAVILTGATLLFALRTSGARPHVQRVAQVVVVVAIAGSALALALGDAGWAAGAQICIGLGIAAVVPFVIMGQIARSDAITFRLVVGGLVVYLLIGLCYAYVFGLISLISGQPFFHQTDAPTTETYLYFSYTTLSTVGYGDYSAAMPLGQMIAISEALFGQLYLVSIVAVLVANIGRSFRQVKDQ